MNGFFMYAYVSNQINRKYKSYWAYQFLPNLILANDDQIFKSRFIEAHYLPILCNTFWLTIFQIWCSFLKSNFFKSIFLRYWITLVFGTFVPKFVTFLRFINQQLWNVTSTHEKKDVRKKVKSENFFCEISMEEFQSNLKHISFIQWIESKLCIIQKVGLDCWGYLSMILSKILMKFSMLSAIEIKFWQL